jgi:hypothetical protein
MFRGLYLPLNWHLVLQRIYSDHSIRIINRRFSLVYSICNFLTCHVINHLYSKDKEHLLGVNGLGQWSTSLSLLPKSLSTAPSNFPPPPPTNNLRQRFVTFTINIPLEAEPPTSQFPFFAVNNTNMEQCELAGWNWQNVAKLMVFKTTSHNTDFSISRKTVTWRLRERNV